MPGRDGSFCHLHTHTEFSMLDGAARVKEVVAAAVADGQPALGITDHGNMYGVLDFYKECRAQGINPVIGTEAYMAANSRFERPARRGRIDDTGGDVGGGEKLYYHLTLLAENAAGYRNLMKLSSAAYLEGYYYKPRLDWELLERHHEGIIATSGCLGGLVLQALLAGNAAQARATAGRLQDIFGREGFFVEIQDHGLDAQQRTNPELVELARHIGAPLLATNDSHYTAKEHAVAHDALLCVQTGATIDDPKRFKFEGQEHYLKSAAEMRTLFAELPEACDNTLLVAERANVEIELGRPRLPQFQVPEEFRAGSAEESATRYLRHLTFEGAEQRYGSPLSGEVVQRVEYELGVIADMGFSAYFLVVWDLIRHARENSIRVGPGRGSAAGSCVAYCLRIVNIDPIRNGLIFERFLNPGRKSMPDIDMDFDERFRSEMIRYASDRYGWDHVAQIVTFSTIKARAAVRDAARVLGYGYAVGDRIAKAMPALVMGRDTPLAACLQEMEGQEDGYRRAGKLREMYEADPEAREVIDVARGLEGLRRQDGIHAAAVVITDEPLTEYLPIQRKPDPGGSPADAPIVTQYEMHAVEELGLLKMDFLGLRNLSIIERALDRIEAGTGVRPDIDAVPLDDEATFAMLRRGDTIGVFQMEGSAMRKLVRSLAPTGFDDVAALIALYRPGPMAANMHNDYADRKNGRQQISYPHPDMEEVLADTQGLMIYQESLMRVAQRFAGYSLEEADNLRKACGKKIRALMAKEREQFVASCARQGYGEELGKHLFDIIEPFADYAFAKSHAYGYGLIAYQTAWLKANYPLEYMAALLSAVKDDKDRTAVYLAECRALGIKVLVPDVNRSEAEFSVAQRAPNGSSAERGTIVFGLAAVRNVGEGLVARIVEEREKNGPFADIYDFCARVDPIVLNKRTMESLAKAGAFDSLGHPRQGLCLALDRLVDAALERRKEEELGIMTLFDAASQESSGRPASELRVPVPATDFDKGQRLAFEREMLGLYVSDHPLMGLEGALRRHVDLSLSELRDEAADGAIRDGDTSVVGGIVTSFATRWTKRGDLMATFMLEDLSAQMEIVMFSRAVQEYGDVLAEDAVVCVKVRVEMRDEQLRAQALEAYRPDLEGAAARVMNIKLPLRALDGQLMGRVKAVLADHHGDVPVRLHVAGQVLQLPPEYAVDPGNGLLGELRELLGPAAVLS